MRIFRGPRSASRWSGQTDSKALAGYIANWTPGHVFVFDATIDKAGERHTDLGVQIEEEDIPVLMNALVQHYRSRIERLTKESESRTERLAKENERLKDAVRVRDTGLGKIERLVSLHRHEAPSDADFVGAVTMIANKTRWSFSGGADVKLDWIEWDEI